LKRLEASGHEIKRGKYISVRAPGQERFTRTKTLGADYTEDAITKRIAGEYIPAVDRDRKVKEFVFDTPEVFGADTDSPNALASDSRTLDKPTYVRPAPAVNLIIDIENCVKAQQSAGFARWQKIQNLKEAAKTLNFLTENNLLQYADLERKTIDVATTFDDTADALKAAEKRLKEMASLMKHITNYQQTKPVYDGLNSGKNHEAYRREHESAIILHESAARSLRRHAGVGGKLPNPATLQSDYARLADKKNALRAEYSNLKRQSQEYGVVKKNVDSILVPGTELARTKARSAEL